MRDVIRDAMTRPDCILGVVPDGGGMWLSPLRPDTPRNFAEKPEEWNDAMTAANQIGSDDWSFQIKMNVLSQIQQTSGEIFNNDSGSPLKIYGDLIASGSAAFYLRNYVELETWTGKHELQLDVVSGNATLYVDGTLVATKPTGLSTLNFTRASKTSADIEIEFVEFRNLTTSETVWQASRDELYETNPWPSATPINFATGSYTWDSFNAIQNTVDFSHDFTFEIEFECTVQESARIFYISSTESLFGLSQFSTGFVIFTTCLLGRTDIGRMYTEFSINPAGTYLTGRHVAKMVIEGNTATAYLDDVVIGAANAEYINRVTPSKLSAPTSKCGYIYFMRLTDDTTGKVIWSYPSEAERVRLLTKTNVRTDRGVFEAADTTKSAAIATQLTDTPQTFLVFDEDGELLNNVTIPNGVFTIPAGTKIRALLGFDRALTAAEIAAFGNVEQEGEHQILCEPFSSFCIENK